MVYILIVVLLVLIAFAIVLEKRIINPITMFAGLWCGILFLNSLRLYEMFDFGEKAIAIIAVGIFGFLVGYFLLRIAFFSMRKDSLRSRIRKATQRHMYPVQVTKTMYACLAVSMIFNLVMAVQVLMMLRMGLEYGAVRDLLFGTGGESMFSGRMYTVYSWINIPIVYALTPIMLIMIVERHPNKKFILLQCLNLVLYTFASSGRIQLIFIAVQMLVLLEMYNVRIPKKMKKWIWRAVFAVLIVGLAMTVLRIKKTTNTNVNSVYAYFSIPVSLLGHWVDKVDSAKVQTYGIAFFYGILTILSGLLENIGIGMPKVFYVAQEYISMTQNSWIEVFPKKWFNAFVSIFYYFYLDWGFFGVFIGCAVFGMICYYSYYKVLHSPHKRYMYIYLLMTQCIISSFARWQLGNASFLISVILMSVLASKHKIKAGVRK